MTPSDRIRRRGVSAVEIVLIILLVGAAFVPIYSIFIRTRETTFRSERSYLALHAAREELQEVRTMPLFGIPARE